MTDQIIKQTDTFQKLQDAISQSLSELTKELPDESVEDRIKREMGIGMNILRWARNGFLKVDAEALADHFGNKDS